MRRALLVILISWRLSLLAAFALPLMIDVNKFRPAIESELAKSLGRDVKIGNLKLSILSGAVTADDLSVGDDPSFSQTAFLRTKALTLSIDLWQMLFSRKLRVSEITIDTPEAVLIQSPSGVWNFSSLGAKSATKPGASNSANGNLALSMKSLNIKGAHLSLTQGRGTPAILENVNVQAKNFEPGSVVPFSMSAKLAGGGNIALEGKAGPINPADAANTPLTANLKIKDLSLAASGAVPATSGIDGIVSADGTVTSNGQTLSVTTTVKAEKLKLATGGAPARNPLVFDAAFTEDLKQHSGQLSRGDISIGPVKARLSGAWIQEGEVPARKMVLSPPAFPVSGLADLLPSLDIKLPPGSTLEGGSATANLSLSGPASALDISGPVAVRNTLLKGFDLGAKMSAVEKLAGIKSGPNMEVQTLSANLKVTPQATSLQNLHVVLPAVGELAGAGTISPSHALDFKMRATVHTNVVVSVLTPPNIPFLITGTSSDPQFRPEVGQLATEEINRGVNGVKTGGLGVGKTAGKALQGLLGGKK